MKKSILATLLLGSAALQAADYGCQSMVWDLKRVMMKRPDQHYAVQDPEKWHYTSQPDLAAAQQEHDSLAALLRRQGVDVVYHNVELADHADALFVYDPAIITERGGIILKMGKNLRRGEEAAMEKALTDAGIPILYRLDGQARLEGGDTLWLDERTLAVGQGKRSNAEGLRQLREALDGMEIEIVPVTLPEWGSEEACLHLMSLISPVDETIAVVYKKLLPESFVKLLEEREIQLVDVSDADFERMGTNILTIRPGVVVMLEGIPAVKADLEALGLVVLTYKGEEISLKSEGGPTCLTRPLLRSTRPGRTRTPLHASAAQSRAYAEI